MNKRLHLLAVAAMVGFLAAGCGKDDDVADSSTTPVNIKSGVPSNLPSNAPPVVSEQIKASQDAGAAMQSQAQKNGDAYNAARAKSQ